MDTPRLTPSVSSHNSNVPSPIRVPSPEKWQAQKMEEEPVTARAAAIEIGEVEDEAFAAKTEQLALGTTPQDAYVMPTFGDADRGLAEKSAEGGGMGRVVVISGGSGYNDLVGATPEATFVMPISDNGGSSSEIIRVLGGPSIGDLRSRLVRLIPVSAHQPEIGKSNDAVHRLLAYRLPSTGSSKDIKQEWMDILEGRHKLWRGIEPERKECIRGFLVHFEADILRRAHRNFNFRGGSIGNFFLAAAQKFFRSIQSAIFLFSVTTQSHSPLLGGARVLPVINTNHTATIAAELVNGDTIVGQCEISHPAVTSGTVASSARTSASNTGPVTPAESVVFDPFHRGRQDQQQQGSGSRLTVGAFGDGLEPSGDEQSDGDEDEVEDDKSDNSGSDYDDSKQGRRPRRHQGANIVFSKVDESSALPAPIDRVYYVNAYRNEVHPAPNPAFLSCLSSTNTLVYSCGSLWTSLVPCLALRGVAKAIKSSPSLRYKILLLNSTHDRETVGLDAVDFVNVIHRALLLYPRHYAASYNPSDFVTHVVYFEEGAVKVDEARLTEMNITCVRLCTSSPKMDAPKFNEENLKKALYDITGKT